MKLNEQIREHRKKLGLTQEQIADSLGVSTPAVNKWESGSTYPDITLLPPLARLLKIDLNTLFTFHEDLSLEEVNRFCGEVEQEIISNGFQAGFAATIQKLQEYPNCTLLKFSLALLLEGRLQISHLTQEEQEKYICQLIDWYEQIANSQDEEIREPAISLLVNKYLACGKTDKAQELVERLPDKRATDKHILKINVLLKQGNYQEAAMMTERKIYGNIAIMQSYLMKLVDIDLLLNEMDTAAWVADVSQKMATVLGLWEYNRFICSLQVAVAAKDVPRCLELIQKMLEAAQTPFKTPAIFRHLPNEPMADDLQAKVMMVLLRQFETDKQYEFLHSNSDFQALMAKYKKIHCG